MTSRLRTLARGFRLPGAADPPPAPEPTTDHDTAEAEAMADHYAQPAALQLHHPADLNALRDGLHRGFHAHRHPARR